MVRIGFGKADSAPVAPSKGIMSPGGIVSPASALPRPSPNPGLNSPGGGIDAQLQSTPTRALWIGSIPSTTTPATILSVFSPFGPIESARVLTHKNCGFSMSFSFLAVVSTQIHLRQSILNGWMTPLERERLSMVEMFLEVMSELFVLVLRRSR